MAVCLIPGALTLAQTNVLTANYDNNRSNANLSEHIISPGSLVTGGFGKLYSYPVDGDIYAQPLYVGALDVDGEPRPVLFVATMHNSLYAFDTSLPPQANILWHANFGTPVPNEFYNFNDISPEVGILSTPVIDLAAGVIYLVANTLEDGSSVYRLHALDLTSGIERPSSPVVIAGSAHGIASDGDGSTVPFNANEQLQRPGLLLSNGTLYIAFGSHGDDLPYHGWIIAYDSSTLQRLAAMTSTPNGLGGSFWQSGNGIAVDEAGSLYAMSANGDFDGVSNFGETLFRLTPGSGLGIADWFTPENWGDMNGADMEVGNSGPVLIPGTNLVVGAGKLGNLYLLQRDKLGNLSAGDSHAVQTFQAVNFGIFGRALWGRPSNPMLFVSGWNEPFRAYQMHNRLFDTTPVSVTSRSFVNPYVGMTVSADGGRRGSAILWVTTADETGFPVPGALRAFDAENLAYQIWSSDSNPNDSLGYFSKFAIPTVADGRVYVPTFSEQVVVYGFRGDPLPFMRAPLSTLRGTQQ